MAINILEELEILDVYLKNEYQEIFICKKKDSHEKYLLNILLEEDIDFSGDLRKLPNYLDTVKIVETKEGKINILTKYYEDSSLVESLGESNISLSKQTSYSTSLLDKLMKFKNFEPWIIKSLFNYKNIVIDREGNIKLTGIILIDDNYNDIANKDVLKDLGETLHVIYSGVSLESASLSSNLPPDIKNILISCVGGTYNGYEDLVREFKGSKLYDLINPESKEGLRVHSMRTKMRNKRFFYSFKKTTLRTALIILLLSPLLVFSAGKLIGFIGEKLEDSEDKQAIVDVLPEDNNDDVVVDTNDEDIVDEDKSEDDTTEDTNETISEDDSLDKYYNENLVVLGEGEEIGKIDNTTSHKGAYSIRVDNTNGTMERKLVAIIDLTSDEYSFLRDRKVDVSLWLKSNITMDSVISLELIKDNSIIDKVSNRVNILENTWTLHSTSVNTGASQYIKIYISLEKAGEAWVDSISIDILK